MESSSPRCEGHRRTSDQPLQTATLLCTQRSGWTTRRIGNAHPIVQLKRPFRSVTRKCKPPSQDRPRSLQTGFELRVNPDEKKSLK